MTGDLRLLHGDALDLLRADALGYPHALGYHPGRLIPDASVDAIVTDPPYGLGFMGKAWDDPGSAARAYKGAEHLAATPYGRARAEYGGASYGSGHVAEMRAFGAWCEEWAAECLRVLKPGGYLVAFGGTRTVHRLTCGVEDAGFEIRDGIDWLYGSGFPKSLDVSKAIDKANGRRFEDRYALGRHLRERRETAGLTRAEVNGWLGSATKCDHYESESPGFARLPTLADWRVLRERLGLSDEFAGLVERAEAERQVVGRRTDGAGNGSVVGLGTGRSMGTEFDVTTPATDDAARWAGWGTALKPAREPIVVARKPLAGTVAANVLEHGTGALNIDACRVGTTKDVPASPRQATDRSFGFRHGAQTGAESGHDPNVGRWPSNVVLSHVPLLDDDGEPVGDACAGGCVPGCPVADLDAQSGVSASTRHTRGQGLTGGTYGTPGGPTDPLRGIEDTGGASRFFPVFRYQAKAPARERPKVAGVAHPTVKPLALMRWLVRLVCPPGGTVLDLFAGSGTTGEACLAEGFPCLLIEREADYLPLIAAREARTTQAVLI